MPVTPTVQLRNHRILTIGCDLRSILGGHYEIDATSDPGSASAFLAVALEEERPYALAFIDVDALDDRVALQILEKLWKTDVELQIAACTSRPGIIDPIVGRDGLLVLKKPFTDAEAIQFAGVITTKWNLAAEARRQTKQLANRESEWRKLSLVASRTTNSVLITDAQGRIEWVNEGFTRMTGYTLEDLIGCRPIDRLRGPDTDPATVQMIADHMSRHEGFKVEMVNYTKSNRKRWVEVELQPVWDTAGVLQNFVGIGSDITDRKHAEEERFLLGNHIRLLLDSTGEGIYGINTDGVITFINRAAAKLLGFTPDEIIGKNAHALLHHQQSTGEYYPVEDCPIYQTMRKGNNCRVETEVFWRRDGRAVPVSYSAFPVWENGLLTGAVVTFFDISARKLAEAELRNAKDAAESANRAKSEFLARMSHEIRTPLNGVVGIIDLLNATELDANQQRYTRLAQEAADALIAVINDILDFSKIEAGKIEIEWVEFELHKLVQDLVEMLRPVAAKKGLPLICTVEPGVPSRVVGDPNRIRQVLTNLVGNAIKFTAAGQVSTRVSLLRNVSGHYTVAIEVQDTGIGIPADRLDRLFKKFSQVDTSTTRRFGGTGLGLAISKRLVELMGGDVTFCSEEGKGTTFHFTVMLKIPTAPPATPDPASPAPEQVRAFAQSVRPLSPGLHLLVAEDNVMNQFIAKETLKRAGCTCQIVADGNLALAALESGRYDAILMDCQMPFMDGLEATRRIRKMEAEHPDQPRIPIIALTADAIEGDKERCLAAGMDGYVPKPMNPARLIAAIRSLVGERCEPMSSTQKCTADPK